MVATTSNAPVVTTTASKTFTLIFSKDTQNRVSFVFPQFICCRELKTIKFPLSSCVFPIVVPPLRNA